MTNKYKEILLVYLRNPIFVILSGLFCATVICDKVLLDYGRSFLPPHFLLILGDDVVTFTIVLAIWLPFVMGVLIKRQFASHRASLLPNYRPCNIRVALLLFLVFILMGSLGTLGIHSKVPIDFTVLWGIYLSFMLLFLLLIYLGYLSIGNIVFLAYFGTTIILSRWMTIVTILSSSIYVNYFVFFLIVFLLLCLMRRLSSLREDSFEYPYLFSWPQKDFIHNQLQASQLSCRFVEKVRSILGIKSKNLVIPKYPKTKNILFRSVHWGYIELAESRYVLLALTIITPFYLFYIKSHETLHYFFTNAYSNFLLLAISPVLIAVSVNYKKTTYWGYDSLKPIRKSQFIKERGVILFLALLFYWVSFCLYFTILPNIFIYPAILGTVKFWGYILLTGTFAFAILSWIAFMSCLTDPRAVLINGIISSLISLFFFLHAPEFSLGIIFVSIILCVILGFEFSKLSYRKWCEKEFE